MSRSLFIVLAAAVTLGGLATVVGAARAIVRFAPSWTRALSGCFLVSYGVALLFRPAAWPVIDLMVLTGAMGGALLIERSLRSPGAVAAFLATAAVVDIVSMTGGLSRTLIERYRDGTSDLLLYLTLVVPVRARAIPIVGIGDLIVGGASATALLRLGIRPVAVMAAFAMALLVALAYGLWRGGAPALPFIAVAVLLLVRRQAGRSPPRADSDGAAITDPGRGA